MGSFFFEARILLFRHFMDPLWIRRLKKHDSSPHSDCLVRRLWLCEEILKPWVMGDVAAVSITSLFLSIQENWEKLKVKSLTFLNIPYPEKSAASYMTFSCLLRSHPLTLSSFASVLPCRATPSPETWCFGGWPWLSTEALWLFGLPWAGSGCSPGITWTGSFRNLFFSKLASFYGFFSLPVLGPAMVYSGAAAAKRREAQWWRLENDGSRTFGVKSENVHNKIIKYNLNRLAWKTICSTCSSYSDKLVCWNH